MIEDIKPAQNSEPTSSKAPENTTKKSILFVEDEPFIGDLYKRAFEKAGYEVDLTTDGNTGLDRARTKQFDIIVLDIMIPQILGIDVLHELRKIPNLNAKIVIATNLEQDQETRSQIEKEADAYVIKAEITPNEFVEFLKNF